MDMIFYANKFVNKYKYLHCSFKLKIYAVSPFMTHKIKRTPNSFPLTSVSSAEPSHHPPGSIDETLLYVQVLGQHDLGSHPQL